MKHPIALLCACIVVASLIGGCALLPTSRTQRLANEAPTPTPIPTSIVPTKPTYIVEKGEVVDEVIFNGRISPVVEEELFFRTDGRIRTVFVKRDDVVGEGQVLADLEIAPLERSLEQAELELARARSRQETAERNLTYDMEEATANLEIAQLQLNSLRSSPRPENVAIAIQEERVRLAELAVERLSHGIDPLIINDVESAELQVDKLNAEIEEAQIIAPFDGQVMSIALTPGQAVEGYRPVVVVADVSALEVSADLLSNQMADIQEGLDATVSLLNSPGVEIDGSIRLLPYPYGSGGSAGDKVEDRDKSTRIDLVTSPEEAGYELGDLVRVVVVRERKDDVLWLPPQAIRNFDGRRFVVLIEDEAQRRVDVLVGIETQTRVELEEGVEAGQVVIGP